MKILTCYNEKRGEQNNLNPITEEISAYNYLTMIFYLALILMSKFSTWLKNKINSSENDSLYFLHKIQ